MRGSTPSFEAALPGWVRRCAAVLLLLAGLGGGAAHAHKASDAYLQLESDGDRLSLRWDIALRDIDSALDLDVDGDRQLRWGEVRARQDDIRAWALARLSLQRGRCALAETQPPAIERRVDGAYLVLQLRGDCAPATTLEIDYRLLADIDPTHRGLLRVASSDGSAPLLRSLDPAAGPVTLPWPAAPGLRPGEGASAVAGDAGASAAASTGLSSFFRDGVHHILIGYDHVLFLVCLLLPAVLRRTPEGWRPVPRAGDAVWGMLGIVTMFTLAHSITLAVAGLRLVSLPPRLIEPAIALTIIVAALDCFHPVLRGRHRLFAFAFGLVHGFGFASVLAELELPTGGLLGALLAFNLGVEAGQLVIVAIVLTLLLALRSWHRYPAVVLRGGSALAMSVAGIWFAERVLDARLTPF